MTPPLYEETPCEHGIWDDTENGLEQEHFQDCPGGSRVEWVDGEPDYEAAIKCDWKIYDKAKSVSERAEFVRQIIDAALSGQRIVKEKE